MQLDIDHCLSDGQQELLARITDLCTGKGMSVNKKDNAIIFSFEPDFSVCKVVVKKSSAHIRVKQAYVKNHYHLYFKTQLSVLCENEIVEAIDNIHRTYLEYKSDPERYELIYSEQKMIENQERRQNAIIHFEDAQKQLADFIVKNGDRYIDKSLLKYAPFKLLGTLGISKESELAAFDLVKYSGDIELKPWVINEITSYIKNRLGAFFKSFDMPSRLVQVLTGFISALDSPELSYKSLSDERLNELKKLINDVKCIFDEMLELLSLVSGGFSYLKEYTQTDDTTLESVGKKHSLSRERIRQICNKEQKKIKKTRYYAKNQFPEKTEKLEERISDVFEALNAETIPAFCYIFPKIIGKRRFRLFCSIYFNEDNYIKITDTADKYIQCMDELLKADATMLEWQKFFSKVCFPSDSKYVSQLDSARDTEAISPAYTERIAKKLDGFADFFEYIENPDLTYYSYSNTDCKPRFALRTKDGRLILIVTMSTLYMAAYYNVQKFNALHLFCKENGYGYLVLNDRFESIYEIKQRKINEDLVSELDHILEENNEITWDNVSRLKFRFRITNEVLAGYVLQNKLHLTLRPFLIRKR